MNPTLSNADVLDTRFRSALRRMAAAGRLHTYDAPADPMLEIAGIMKRRDGGPAILFTQPTGHDMPVLGNLLSSKENVEAAFGADFRSIRGFVGRALGNPLPPQNIGHAPVQEVVHREGIDLGMMFPALTHAPGDAGRYFTAGIVIVRDPRTGVYNASYHRLMIAGPDRVAIKLDYGRHLRFAFERAKEDGRDLEVVVVLGADISLHYTAATMGSQMPEDADELAVAGGLAGRALPVTQAVSVDLLVPAESEIALEGRILTNETVLEGPFGEFVGFPAPADQAPVMVIDCVTHRRKPIYHAINGYGRETVMLRKYVLEASLLKAVQPAVPVVTDAEMTAGGMHRFHAVVQVRKSSPQHEGLQRNAILAAFGALKDLDQVIVVDDDIDIRDPLDVEYAVATRFEASKDLLVIPGARGHEYVRASKGGIRAKLGIDATVPFEERERFRRISFADVSFDEAHFGKQPDEVARRLDD
ncbi:2,5-furandicarboxylate decarboxylase 1 [Roseomonas rosea]|uniref:2,5-furandicarboxylate decarboxylase 1 n=1 Tax=Muricoccus roseus TaxID=198092 RepID=A0A1M6N0B3_9PROT|nr:UbiD family decarboxylase [Roseomonas rosea]SHJ89124.1 2,5-furandicarboxylate decarboxylase 1 [Roseomonas rosea]